LEDAGFSVGARTPQGQKAKPVAKAAKPAAPAEASAAPEDDGKLTIAKLQAIQDAKAREYLFNPDGMLDPFRPIEAVLAPRPTEMTPEEMEKLTPLQKLELSQLKLVAVVVSAGGNRALVEDS
jgi:type IV pilus assembly protein PilP